MGEGDGGTNDMSTFTRESVAAVFAMVNSGDLETRIRVLHERAEVPDDRLIPFFVIMPENYDADERRAWIKSVTEALEVVAKDAHQDIMVDRTIKTMTDLGLGDDGDGGFRNE